MLQKLAEAISAIYGVAYGAWNSIVGVAMSLFTTSPTAANGNVYATTYALYNAIRDISIPIAIVFFLIALLKDVVSSPPDQQVRKFAGDGIRFGIMVAILTNLWQIMGYVMQIADGVTSQMGGAGTYTLSVSGDLLAIIDEIAQGPDFSSYTDPSLIQKIITWFEDQKYYLFASIIMMALGLITVIIMVACAISILSSAFQRIIKPLVILPFSCITVAMATGAGDASRITASYLKTFFGFCLSGAFMVISVNLGSALSNGLINISVNGVGITDIGIIGQALTIAIQNAVVPIVIAGLVKSADSIIARFF